VHFVAVMDVRLCCCSLPPTRKKVVRCITHNSAKLFNYSFGVLWIEILSIPAVLFIDFQ